MLCNLGDIVIEIYDISAYEEIGRPVGEAIVIALASELGGALLGKVLSWGIGKMAGTMQRLIGQFSEVVVNP